MDDTIIISEPSILIRINQAYTDAMSDDELYEYTRGRWKVNKERAEKAKYAFSIFKGIIKEVFIIEAWVKAGTTDSFRNVENENELNSLSFIDGRFEFVGSKAPNDVRLKYLGKSVAHYFKKGNSNPIYYINI